MKGLIKRKTSTDIFKGFLLILGFYRSLKEIIISSFGGKVISGLQNIPIFIFAFQVSSFIHASINIFFISNHV